MELGPIQKEWIKSLKENPDRQIDGFLGTGTPEDYKACCLGELHVIGCKMLNEPSPFVDFSKARPFLSSSAREKARTTGVIGAEKTLSGEDRSFSATVLRHVFSNYGLIDETGRIDTTKATFINPTTGAQCGSLAEMNDIGITWPQIADFIEANPDAIFTKSI